MKEDANALLKTCVRRCRTGNEELRGEYVMRQLGLRQELAGFQPLLLLFDLATRSLDFKVKASTLTVGRRAHMRAHTHTHAPAPHFALFASRLHWRLGKVPGVLCIRGSRGCMGWHGKS